MNDRPSIKAALDAASRRLARSSPSPRLDAEILLCAATGCDRPYLHAHAGEPLGAAAATALESLLERRERGEPVAYLTGRREFWSLDLEVAPSTLIPRPDTETLVHAALETFIGGVPARAADLGTGCGAVALALASEWPRCELLATETSAEALEIAMQNAKRLGFDNVRFATRSIAPTHSELSWCAPLENESFVLIVSNPPYVAEGDPHLDAPELRYEPVGALLAGTDGLDAIRAIAACAPAHLVPGGWLLLEHGADQAQPVADILGRQGFARIRHWRDLSGHARVTGGCIIARDV